MRPSVQTEVFTETFVPARGLANAHLQTMLANWPGDRVRFAGLKPTDLVVPLRGSRDKLLGVAYGDEASEATIVVIHGVGGSSESSYVMRAVDHLVSAGFFVVALNLRGAGRGAILAEKMYHSGLIDDLEDVLATVAERRHQQPMGILGFSLGGQIALRLATTWASLTRAAAQALVTVSSPFDLQAACTRLDAGPRWPYRHHILVGLKRNCARSAPSGQRSLPLSIQDIERISSLKQFDEVVTAPMHGFASADAFYAEASCGPHLHKLSVPTLSIHAHDDPVVTVDSLRPYADKASSALHCLWTSQGGHVGFVSSWRRQHPSWATSRAIAFFADTLGQ